jgi:hypothetical protein
VSDQQTEQPWVALYRSALLELDYQQLAGRLQTAGEAIRQRLDAISDEPGQTEEHRSLGDALQNLRVLQREVDNSLPSKGAGESTHRHVELSGE